MHSIGPLAAAVALLTVLWSGTASAQSCTGRFVNPISDVCWECLFPISIGPIRMGSAVGGAGHAEPGIADLLLRFGRSRVSASRSGSGSRPG